MIRKIVVAAITGSLLLGASACNTVKGAGKDIQSVGQAGSHLVIGTKWLEPGQAQRRCDVLRIHAVEIDQLDLGMPSQQPLIVLHIVGVRGAQPTDRDDDDLHEARY